MVAGFVSLHYTSPDFAALSERTLELQSTFRKAHHYLKQHAESVAFFGGASREGATIAGHLQRFLAQRRALAHAQWLHSAVDEFFSKQLPHNATWALTLLYALQRDESAWADATAQVRRATCAVLHSLLDVCALVFGSCERMAFRALPILCCRCV
jgi:ABC transporter transmembrane region 2